MSEFSQISQWPADTVAGALLHRGEVIERVGDTAREFPVASVTKLVAAYGVTLGGAGSSVRIARLAASGWCGLASSVTLSLARQARTA